MPEREPKPPTRGICPFCGLNVPFEAMATGGHQCDEKLLAARNKILVEKKLVEEIADLEQERKTSPHMKFEEYYLKRESKLLGNNKRKGGENADGDLPNEKRERRT